MTAEQDQRIAETIRQEETRLCSFIRKRVSSDDDVEDILQEVYYEFVAASRLTKPIEKVGAWLVRVARNRIIDRFRKKRPQAYLEEITEVDNEGRATNWEDLLPSPDAGPEAIYARRILIEELDEALEELPDEQREIFLAHEVEGRSFKDMAAETGVSINTLLSRKHDAVVYLRRRLHDIYEEFADLWGSQR